MLCFKIDNSGKTVQIYFDDDGLNTFIATLEKMRAENTGHVHLKAPSVGGSILSDKTPWGELAVGEVVLTPE